ncbi:hypothetical protein M885DRAFT_526215 [Pelagophyceae sp. CCMP2097]|nr:hypothetical protein M885DRAFT_526215 [Pelagophyceae sp. CCMP2097]
MVALGRLGRLSISRAARPLAGGVRAYQPGARLKYDKIMSKTELGVRRTEFDEPEPSRLKYELMDVFTETPFGGNPLVVVYGADRMRTEHLQQMAATFNLPETTFILPPENGRKNTCRVRIFTPTHELPFAGHPNIGTACSLFRKKKRRLFMRDLGPEMRFEEICGIVPMTMTRDGAATMESPCETFELRGEMPASRVALCLGLSAEDVVDFDDYTKADAVTVSIGNNPYTLLEVAGLESLAKCESNAEAMKELGVKILAWVDMDKFPAPLPTEDLRSVRQRAKGPASREHDIRCRMFNVLGVEDAATGAASACLLGLLASRRRQSGSFTKRIGQGIEMERPSLLLGECHHTASKPTAIRIAGHSVTLLKGFVLGPPEEELLAEGWKPPEPEDDEPEDEGPDGPPLVHKEDDLDDDCWVEPDNDPPEKW